MNYRYYTLWGEHNYLGSRTNEIILVIEFIAMCDANSISPERI